MPTRFIHRKSALGPGDTQKPSANTIYVDSDTETVKVGSGASGTAENELVSLALAQTIPGQKTITSPIIVTSLIMNGATANLTVTITDQTAAATLNFPDLNGVGAGVCVSAIIKHDQGVHSAAGTSTGTIELPAGSVIHDINARSTVVWNSGTSDVLNVGDDQDANGWMEDGNLQAAGEMILGEVFSMRNSAGGATPDTTGWLGFQGAYLLDDDGRKGQETATSSGDYNTQAHEVISAVLGVGTAPTTGTTFVSVLWSVPTEAAAAFVAT